MRVIAKRLQGELSWLDVKPCEQYFTFFQQNPYDLGNAHRPTWRFMRKDTPLYPESIRVPSWRLLNGDPRANPEGCVPGDVFDIPRVTGNSHQRRAWHPTQLNEDLVTRCIKLVTQEGATVLDPFAGTGTTMRVCKGIKRNSVSIELDRNYCDEIVKEHGMQPTSESSWHIPEAVAWWRVCTDMRSNLAALESGQRVSRFNAIGERVFIDDATRAAEIQRYRNELGSKCAP